MKTTENNENTSHKAWEREMETSLSQTRANPIYHKVLNMTLLEMLEWTSSFFPQALFRIDGKGFFTYDTASNSYLLEYELGFIKIPLNLKENTVYGQSEEFKEFICNLIKLKRKC